MAKFAFKKAGNRETFGEIEKKLIFFANRMLRFGTTNFLAVYWEYDHSIRVLGLLIQ